MQRNKEESVNGIPNKETTTNQKVSKLPIEKPYERKISNVTVNADQVVNKQPGIPAGDADVESKTKLQPENQKSKIVKNIGFENLPDQIYRRSLFNGFEFNLMVVGCSGLGKSTFVNNLFLTELYNNDNLPPSKRAQKTIQINTTTVSITENAVALKLTLIDTPGFGDYVDNSECWVSVVNYIESKYNEYMKSQNRVNRDRIIDNRVHVCLYFIEPTGHGLKPLDIEFMKHIHTKVNVVPVIAKADSLIPSECEEFKKTILHQIKSNGLRIYDFPEEAAAISLGITTGKNRDTNNNWKDLTIKRKRQPFAIVCSNAIVDKHGLKVRGRAYPWGVVEIDNLEHNDFSALRTLLLSSHLQDIKDTTDQILFENYRCKQMSNFAQETKFGVSDGKDPMSQMDEERREFEAKIHKMEEDMQTLFDQKVSEKTKKLEEFQANIERSEREMAAQLEKETKDIELKRNNFESTRLQWEEMNRETNFRASMDALDIKEKNKNKGKWHLK